MRRRPPLHPSIVAAAVCGSAGAAISGLPPSGHGAVTRIVGGFPAAGPGHASTELRDPLQQRLGHFWGQLGDKFTQERAVLDAVFARDPARDEADDLAPGYALLRTRDTAIAELRRRALAVEAR